MLVDIEEYLENHVETMINERNDFAAGSKEKVQHDNNVNAMVKSIVDLKRLESEDQNEERRIEFEINKVEAQLNHEEKWKAEELNQRISEHETEVKQKEIQTKHERKIGWFKIFAIFGSLGGSFILHLLARKDAREGIVSDERQKYLDRNKIMSTLFGWLR